MGCTGMRGDVDGLMESIAEANQRAPILVQPSKLTESFFFPLPLLSTCNLNIAVSPTARNGEMAVLCFSCRHSVDEDGDGVSRENSPSLIAHYNRLQWFGAFHIQGNILTLTTSTAGLRDDSELLRCNAQLCSPLLYIIAGGRQALPVGFVQPWCA
ncbi:hypothetical protein K432DRAFT_231002 [Lepidopterella palustris CBS 459.81]|uniref:Uncharacterized protein n=1 Tax=Lepidopterella palustris CBS 459.81 TaxID=1314670 RepID=A0A8E2JH59_9PEZI|nr:hypothetical protein K432DRAFT_231002 [Lepidopterella palustris CBS 459.81]